MTDINNNNAWYGDIKYNNSVYRIGEFSNGQMINGKVYFTTEEYDKESFNKNTFPIKKKYSKIIYIENGEVVGIDKKFSRKTICRYFKNGKLIKMIVQYDNGREEEYLLYDNKIEINRNNKSWSIKETDSKYFGLFLSGKIIDGEIHLGEFVNNCVKSGTIINLQGDIFQGRFENNNLIRGIKICNTGEIEHYINGNKLDINLQEYECAKTLVTCLGKRKN